MSDRVTIVDYGIGNLLSVARALEHVGAEVNVSTSAAEIQAADRLFLPGVGAFRDGMRGLAEAGKVDPVLEFAASGRPMMGICLGMQMLASESLEFGTHAGLGLIPGRVVPIPSADLAGKPLRTPHIGWADLILRHEDRDRDDAFAGMMPGKAVYLVHSYHMLPDDPAAVLAETDHGGHRVTAAVQSANIVGCQFHPEKSGKVGLELLSAFLRI